MFEATLSGSGWAGESVGLNKGCIGSARSDLIKFQGNFCGEIFKEYKESLASDGRAGLCFAAAHISDMFSKTTFENRSAFGSRDFMVEERKICYTKRTDANFKGPFVICLTFGLNFAGLSQNSLSFIIFHVKTEAKKNPTFLLGDGKKDEEICQHERKVNL